MQAGRLKFKSSKVLQLSADDATKDRVPIPCADLRAIMSSGVHVVSDARVRQPRLMIQM